MPSTIANIFSKATKAAKPFALAARQQQRDSFDSAWSYDTKLEAKKQQNADEISYARILAIAHKNSVRINV